jgi:uncharacterized protein (DUF2267 family)
MPPPKAVSSRTIGIGVLGVLVSLPIGWRLASSAPMGRLVRRLRRRVRHERHEVGAAVKSAWYRAKPRPRSSHVDDDVVADRVRSSLGPLLKRRDLPRPHVMVEGGVALLHGDVATDEDALAIEHATRLVPGVTEVRSRLHVGLLPSDSRPSAGRAVTVASVAMQRLVGAAREAGCRDDERARSAVRAVIAALAGRLPGGERRHLLAHLPLDVRLLVGEHPRRPRGRPARGTGEFLLTVAQADGISPGVLDSVVEGVFGVLRELVPEEAADVAAVLPERLRELWCHAVPQ